MRGLASRFRRGTGSLRQERTAGNGAERVRVLASGQGADLAAFYDRRAAAALAYCSRLCAPDAIADAVEASFARVFESAAGGGPGDEEALDRSLRTAVRGESAARASAATAGVPVRRLFERLADPSRGGACELMPALLAARADGLLGDGDRERMAAHLRRCADCRTAEHRFDEAERAFDALAGEDAPALGRSLLAEMLADAPLDDRRRFARERLSAEPPDWLEEIDWEDEPRPRVVEVPADALEPPLLDEPHPPAFDNEQEDEEEEAEPADAPDERPAAQRNPAVTAAATADFPALSRARLRMRSALALGPSARKRMAVGLLVVAVLLFGEAGVTLLWKEPFTALIAARAQGTLEQQLHKLDRQQLSAAEQSRLASIHDANRRTDGRIAALAARERQLVPAGDALGTLSIKRLGIDYVVVQGTDAASLRKGPAHYSDTPLPGEGGTVGIAGHRTTYEAPFRHVDELRAGDTITMKMPYGLFTYAVDRQRIVPAGYQDAFAGSGTRLVLSACHPLYSASQRILVYAHLVARRPLGSAVEARAPAPVAGLSARAIARRRTARRLAAMGSRTLLAGMTGPDVREVQRLLGLPASGTFGPETAAAVTEFQRTHGLPTVGRVGSHTKAALARRPHPPARPPTPPDVAPQQPRGQTQPNGTGTTPSGHGYTSPGSGTSGGSTGGGSTGGGTSPQGTGSRPSSGRTGP